MCVMRWIRQGTLHKTRGMAAAALRGTPISSWCRRCLRRDDGHRPFYEYYQIGGADKPAEAEAEPNSGGELTGRWEGSHSPFGFIWQVAQATGWSVRHILHGVNYQILIMMLSDAPRYVAGKSGGDSRFSGLSAEAEAAEVAGIFQSNLKG